MTLVLFDFDGTLTRRDTFLDFLLYSAGLLRFASLLPAFLGYAVHLLDNDGLKSAALRRLFRGKTHAQLERMGRRYAEERLPRLLRRSAVARLRWHLEQGHRVVVVSASLRVWLEPWCSARGVELIAADVEQVDGLVTGALANGCHGSAKVTRIRQSLDLSRYSRVVAYGDSADDLPMLGLAHEAYWRAFHREGARSGDGA